jgi:DNA polymerase-4
MIRDKVCFRKILHLDLDAYFCAVEEKLNPDLKGKAFTVGGSPEGRGVVTSCSYAARQFGIKSAMPMKRALSIYPNLIIVHSHYDQYSMYSNRVMNILRDLTPLVEQISIDEAFLDISDLPQKPGEIALNLQKKIFEELFLPCSIGIASNKLVAKIATNLAKSRHKGVSAPMAICEVPPGEEESFLAPLPVNEMWGIGPKVTIQLQKIGIHTIGDIVGLPLDLLVKNLGKFGLTLAQHARGIDERPVMENSGLKSISNETTFFKDISDQDELINTINNLSIKMGQRLRKRKMSGFTIRLKIRWPNFETHTRQLSFEQPTDQDSIISGAAQKLFYQIWQKDMKVRLIGVGISQMTETFQQLSLLDNSFEKEQHLLTAVDNLHQRFGNNIIRRGSSIRYERIIKRR